MWRVVFYVGLGATGFIPMFQLTYMRGAEWTLAFYGPVVKSVCFPAPAPFRPIALSDDSFC